MKMTGKTLFRSIRRSLGRYFAILAIVTLGVGFFTGLRNAQPSMRATADHYLRELNQYDYQLLSTLGFTEEDRLAFAALEGVDAAEGGYRLDALAQTASGEEAVYLLLSLPERVSLPKLTAGRMPEAQNECLADSAFFTEADIGNTVVISQSNRTDTLESLASDTYTIVGLAQSPRFLNNFDRGSTSVGNGTVSGFLYLPASAFRSEAYHELLLSCGFSGAYFSVEYDKETEQMRPKVEQLLSERVRLRYQTVCADAEQALSNAKAALSEAKAQYEQLIASGVPESALAELSAQLQSGEAAVREGEAALASMKEPTSYALGLDSNAGCAAFENDISIVSGIANAFPVFFVLIAALVCITTMTRMVNEERTQIGTLKALGYSNWVISLKYLLYAVSASVIGCVVGFFLGTGVIPQIIWRMYRISYQIVGLSYYFSPLMYSICLAVTLLGASAATLFACQGELRGKPAELIRPKSPPTGKRILLEHFQPLWKRLSFLNKVTIRNAFRYKKRMLMLLLGIGGCTALMVTGFGLKNSVAHILDDQYDEILHYDASVSFDSESGAREEIESLLSERADRFVFGYQESLTVRSEKGTKEATVTAVPREEASSYFGLHSGKKNIPYPQGGEAVLTEKLADILGVRAGDTVTLIDGERELAVTVTGICDNYLYHYVYLAPESIPDGTRNAAFYAMGENAAVLESAAELRAVDGVSYVTVASEERAIMEQSMSSINYIVMLVLLCAGALAFIVLCNLTNINIMERVREVATVQVLGFRPAETASYVLRENLFLSFTGALLGLALGKLLHWYVMGQIQVDIMSFDVWISGWSYALSLLCTVVFAVIANLFMRIRLNRVNMAESLKSVE